jgi:hypothetical protein
MDTNKPATKKASKKKASRKRKTLVDDPPIIIGGGGGSALVGETFISLPKDTPKILSLGEYDIYRVGYDVKTIVTRLKKNGTPKKEKPEGDGWDTTFHKTDV